MNRLPSRLRIAILSAAISGIVLVAFGISMASLIRASRLETVDREIRTTASRHPGLFSGRGAYERLASSLAFAFGADYTNHVILLICDASGRALYRSPHWPSGLNLPGLDQNPADEAVHDPSEPPQAGSTNAESGTQPERGGAGRGGMGRGYGMGMGMGMGMGRGGPPPENLVTRPPLYFSANSPESSWRFGKLTGDSAIVYVGLNQQEVDVEFNRLGFLFLAALPVALFLVGWGGWIVAGRALAPLKHIAETAERVTARGLDQRITASPDSPEAERLVQVLNRMMDRLETSFRQATRFSADASHELKTPLAVMQGELENALHDAPPGSAEQRLFTGLLEEVQRLKTVTRSLLLLARADAGQLELARERFDLSADIDSMIEDARALASGSPMRCEASVTPGIQVDADRALLHTAIFNLLSNAIKYGETQMTLTLDLHQGRARLEICNDGPGIKGEEQAKVFERFYRAARERSGSAEGVGLGLSLAREIVRAHGGDLVLKESRPGWTCFELSIEPMT